ncbi:MAG: radical SAM protein [Candidatus Zixiibacteriota bacterium]|nr:MAG: radical SAM protein [candidate division Zixibacteria bacterium]
MPPFVCNYYLTLRCNARCTFCDLWARPDQGLAQSDAVLRNIAQLPAAGVRIIDFTGGEPLLHPDLPLFLKSARACGLRTTVTTNGLLYPKRAADLKGLVNLLHFSLDASTAERHDALRGVPCFDQVMASLELALSLGEKPELLFTAAADNYLEVVPLAELAGKLGLILIVNPAFEVTGTEGALNRRQLQELVRLCDRPYVYLNGGVARLMLDGGNDPARPRCRAVSATVVISPDDRLLLPCFHRVQDALPLAGDLRRALKSAERRVWLRRQGRMAFCRGCTINCYLAPSLPYRWDRYLASFLPWMARYFYYKNRRPRAADPFTPSKPAP